MIQKNVQEDSEEEINRELQRNTIHNNFTEYKFVDFLWGFKARRFACGNSEWDWSYLAYHLCLSLSLLCSQRCKGSICEAGGTGGHCFPWDSNGNNSNTSSWKHSSHFGRNYMRWIDHRHVRFSSFRHGTNFHLSLSLSQLTFHGTNFHLSLSINFLSALFLPDNSHNSQSYYLILLIKLTKYKNFLLKDSKKNINSKKILKRNYCGTYYKDNKKLKSYKYIYTIYKLLKISLNFIFTIFTIWLLLGC